MKLIQQNEYKKELIQAFSDSFKIDVSGLYVFAITASARSWWQNTKTMRSFLNKDNLTILLDNRPIIPFQKKKLHADDLWNGNILKGHDQTVYGVVHLDAGTHSLSFIAHGKPILDHITLFRSENQEIELKKLKPEKRDRIPWLIFIFNESVSLSSLTIKAAAEKHRGDDDDDLRLSLNGDIIKNDGSHTHRDWYWCGKDLKGISKTFQKNFDKDALTTRIDLDADGAPVIEMLTLMVSSKETLTPLFTVKDVRTYVVKGAHGREDYNRFDQEIVDAVNQWNTEFDDEYPPPEPLHPNLVKALIYIESRMGYFETNGYPSFPDVMQVADPDNPAIHTLNNDGWRDKKGRLAQEREWKSGAVTIVDYKGRAQGATSKESILYGVRWLYHCAQGITQKKIRYWKSWKEATKIYNGSGNPSYANEVYDVYIHGIDHRNKNHPLKIFFLCFLFLTFLSFTTFGVQAILKNQDSPQIFDESPNIGHPEDVLRGAIPQRVRKIMSEKMKIFERQDSYYYGTLFEDAANLCRVHDGECDSDYIFSSYLDELISKSQSMHAFQEVIQPFDLINAYNSFYDDLDNDGEAELVAVMPDFLNRIYLEIMVIDQKKNSLYATKTRLERPYGWGAPRIVDLTGDGVPEIVVLSSGGRQDVQAYVFQYARGELKKIFDLERGYLHADVIITDQNHNRLPEIKIKGEQYGTECMACDHKKIEEVFEYNPSLKKFDLLSSI